MFQLSLASAFLCCYNYIISRWAFLCTIDDTNNRFFSTVLGQRHQREVASGLDFAPSEDTFLAYQQPPFNDPHSMRDNQKLDREENTKKDALETSFSPSNAICTVKTPLKATPIPHSAPNAPCPNIFITQLRVTAYKLCVVGWMCSFPNETNYMFII